MLLLLFGYKLSNKFLMDWLYLIKILNVKNLFCVNV